MDAGDLTALTAAELAARVRDGLSSAVDVAGAHLARIAERDPAFGAFQACDPARVLIEAGAVDTRHDRFALPLAGVPVVVDDIIDVAGYPTRRGSAATSAEPASRDDALVKSLRAAGAVIIGKTRVPELGIWADTPSDPDRGGAAAAVAAGMAVLAIGLDDGGALRVPAARCGLVALKPGSGRVAPVGGAAGHGDAGGLAEVGALGRTAGDVALALAVLAASPMPSRRIVADQPVPERIAVSLRNPGRSRRLHADHRAAVIGAAARLRAWPGAASVVLADPPYPRGLDRRWRGRRRVGVVDDIAALVARDAVDVDLLERRTARLAAAGRRGARFGLPRPATAWRDQMTAWLDTDRYDLLICPAVSGPPEAGGLRGRGYRGSVRAAARQASFTMAWNLAGLPAVVAPIVVGGRRAAVQLVGRPGAEAALLSAAALLEQSAVPAPGAARPRVYA